MLPYKEGERIERWRRSWWNTIDRLFLLGDLCRELANALDDAIVVLEKRGDYETEELVQRLRHLRDKAHKKEV